MDLTRTIYEEFVFFSFVEQKQLKSNKGKGNVDPIFNYEPKTII